MTQVRAPAVDLLDTTLDLLRDRPLVVLTGAGLSTDSGIPDYRGPQSRYADVSRGVTPPGVMTYQQFISGPTARQRYWARSHIGWSRMRGAEPNAGHRAVAALDPTLLITQNVDGLHESAGTRSMVALHGRIADVICLDCRMTSARSELQERMRELNPGFDEQYAAVEVRPDGDVALEETESFVVPDCEICGGVLKPDVVFFGENVPPPRVERAYAAVDRLADPGRPGALLVAGSSLTVMSGFRFVRRAAKAGVLVVIVNRGVTRGDDLAAYKLELGVSEFLTRLATAG
ncbi:hypothetical protein GCM10027020_27410 [Nocardioides salsibiostraticola]